MKNAIIYLVVFLGVQAAVSLIMPAVWLLCTGSSDMTAALLITITAVFSTLSIALFLLARWAEVSRAWLLTRPWSVLFWSVIAALGLIIPSTWMMEQLPDLPNIVEQEFDTLLSTRWGYLTIGLLAPVAEEIVFRGAILKTLLTKYRPWVAIALSALLFSVGHLNPAQMPHTLLVGLLLGWLYYRTDSIIPGVVYHWVNNTVAYVLYNFYPNPDMTTTDLFGSQQHVLMAVGFSLCILLPSLLQLNLRMQK